MRLSTVWTFLDTIYGGIGSYPKNFYKREKHVEDEILELLNIVPGGFEGDEGCYSDEAT